MAVGCNDGTVAILDVATVAVMRSLRGDKPISCLVFSPDGHTIAAGEGWGSGGTNYAIRLYDVEAGTQSIGCPLNVDSWVFSVAFSPCGKTMAVGCENGKVVIVDVATVAEMRSLRGHSDR